MNELSESLRPCTLTDDQLTDKIDAIVESMVTKGEFPCVHVYADPNTEFDLMVDELILRFKEYKRTIESFRRNRANAV